MALHAQRRRHPTGRGEFLRVTLAVAHAQGVEVEPVAPGDGGSGVGIKAPAEEDDGARHRVLLSLTGRDRPSGVDNHARPRAH